MSQIMNYGDMMTLGNPTGGMMMGPDGVAKAGALPPGGQNQIGQPMMMRNQMANQATGDDATANQPATTDANGNWKGFGDFFGGIGDWLSDYAGPVAGIGTIAGALNNANDTRQLGVGIQAYLDSLGGQLNSGSQFQGYGVTTGLGSGSSGYQPVTGADGKPVLDADNNPVMQLQTNLGLDEETNKLVNTMQTGYTNAFADSASAYNAMDNVSSGQTSTDFNAMSSGLQTAANGITPGQGAFGTQAQSAAAKAMADPSARQQEIYNQMMATQNPELNRMQAEQQAAEYARGRGGVRGSQYGGTAEDAAMARARAQASNQANLSAMQQADSERQTFGQMAGQFGQLGNQNYANMANHASQLNNAAAAFGGLGNQAGGNAIQEQGMLAQMGSQLGQLGQQYYQNSFMPMQQQMAAMQLGQSNADMAQTGQLTGLDYMSQLALGGANANMQAQHSANQLTGNLYDTLLSNIGGAQGSDGGSASGLLGGIGNGLDWITKLLGGITDGEQT
jgi:hypothetical protein